MRYEDRGFLRMQAKREGRAKNDERIEGETMGGTVSPEHKAWRDRHIKTNMAANLDANATDHSSIMTNPEHAEKALAYDVAVGMCTIPTKVLHEFRIAADWRLHEGLLVGDEQLFLAKYFKTGTLDELSLHDWAITRLAARAKCLKKSMIAARTGRLHHNRSPEINDESIHFHSLAAAVRYAIHRGGGNERNSICPPGQCR